jgi:tRNA threonylcarbamoyladenosine biosynthesis protein TsaB
MMILTLRTDKPDAEVGIYDGLSQDVYETWPAHRQLAETIHLKIAELLKTQELQLQDLDGLVVFKGPGSFTGLRIGVSVANALAESLDIPLVGSEGDSWVQSGIQRLLSDENDSLVLPEYGALPNVSTPKK